MRARFRDFDPFSRLRKKLIRETEVALLYASRFLERMQRIPTVEVGHGAFQSRLAERFWTETLDLDATARS